MLPVIFSRLSHKTCLSYPVISLPTHVCDSCAPNQAVPTFDYRNTWWVWIANEPNAVQWEELSYTFIIFYWFHNSERVISSRAADSWEKCERKNIKTLFVNNFTIMQWISSNNLSVQVFFLLGPDTVLMSESCFLHVRTCKSTEIAVGFITPTEGEYVLRLLCCLQSCLPLCALTLLNTLRPLAAGHLVRSPPHACVFPKPPLTEGLPSLESCRSVSWRGSDLT